MNRNRFLLVFDYETDSKYKETAEITEIAALPVDLRNLTMLEDEIFAMHVRPDDIDNKDYFEAHEDTINFHALQRGVEPREIFEEWKRGVPAKEAWVAFVDYVKEYATSSSWNDLPIPAGQNIRGFDLPISDRYAAKFKKKLKFSKRDTIDLMDLTRPWFMFDSRAPKSLSMDELRVFFGLTSDGAHTAVKDVIDTGTIITKFLQLHERIAPKISWRTNND